MHKPSDLALLIGAIFARRAFLENDIAGSGKHHCLGCGRKGMYLSLIDNYATYYCPLCSEAFELDAIRKSPVDRP